VIELDEVQKAFFAAVRRGENVCLTGGGGVGKTFTINKMREATKKKSIAMTATTGLAAMHVSGQTVHRFSGMGGWSQIGHLIPIMRADSWNATKEKIKAVDIVVIDEVSMLLSNQFDLINAIFKKATGRLTKPFGGKQIILVGDFLQLPPVYKDTDGIARPWAFQSYAWVEGGFKTFHLTEVKRQNDIVFINALNEIRFGRCSPMTEVILRNKTAKSHSERPVKLVPKNKQADALNNYEIMRLKGREHFLKARIEYTDSMTLLENEGTVEPNKLTKYKKGLYKDLKTQVNVGENIWVKDGCRVIIMANNDEQGYVNGMTGNLVRIDYMVNTGIMKYEQAKDLIEHREIPCEYTLERYIVKNKNGELEETETESGYLAIPQWKVVGEEIRNWLNNQVSHGDFSPSLLAQIQLDNGSYVYVEKKLYEIKDNTYTDDYVSMVSFNQFPLRPAYAISIHKSQGMTLDNVEVECEGIFAEGQMYVALSRATSLAGLSLKNFDKRLVRANADALKFYQELKEGETNVNA